jgi:DNA-binding protein HU-beta
MDVVSAELVKGGNVQLIGFGTFTTAKRAEKNGVNPATKQPMVIPACTYPKFTPGKALKDAVK